MTVRRRPATVGARGVATLATVRCMTGPCHVTAPRRVRLVVGGRTFRARIMKPATLRTGRRGAIRIELSRTATRALAGRRAQVRFRVTLRAGAQSTTRLVRVTLRRR
jgi:hypothetical protein